jgi:hypothetical protein
MGGLQRGIPILNALDNQLKMEFQCGLSWLLFAFAHFHLLIRPVVNLLRWLISVEANKKQSNIPKRKTCKIFKLPIKSGNFCSEECENSKVLVSEFHVETEEEMIQKLEHTSKRQVLTLHVLCWFCWIHTIHCYLLPFTFFKSSSLGVKNRSRLSLIHWLFMIVFTYFLRLKGPLQNCIVIFY